MWGRLSACGRFSIGLPGRRTLVRLVPTPGISQIGFMTSTDLPMSLPASDPSANYRAHKSEIDTAIATVLAGGSYILGPQVEAFERELAAYIGVSHAVGVASGTDALHLAMRACGIGPGHAVVTVSHTAVATVAAVELAGAAPVLVDIDPASFTIDCDALEAAVRADWGVPLKAIIVVHLYGHPANMPVVMDVAGRYGLRVIEDCAQSHGASIAARKTGSLGHIAAFSFYPTKNLGALGDGGAVATNDSALADRVRLLREYGWRQRYISDEPGMNSRLDELQAAILRVKLPYLDSENASRSRYADAYGVALENTGLILPNRGDTVVHAWHQYVVRSTKRDDLRAFLSTHGVGTLIHYPTPVHLQPAYRDGVRHGTLARTEEIAHEILSLPMYPELGLDRVKKVGELIRTWSKQG
jgi:dTDP-4-amino-4,6-dideoxygalactose transaminase